MQPNNIIKNSITKNLVAFCLFVTLSVSLSAQSYYYNKAREYLSLRWRELAFDEFQNGVKAGEQKCILPLCYCYIYEIGTPMDLAKAEALFELGAKEDPVIAFLASYIYDGGLISPYDLRVNYYDYLDYDNIPIWKFARNYRDDLIIPADPAKALKFARLFHKVENGEKGQMWKDYIEFKCYLSGVGGMKKDLDKALALKKKHGGACGFSIEELLNDMLKQSDSFEDMGEIVMVMRKSGNYIWTHPFIPQNYFVNVNNSYSDRSFNAQFVDKFSELFQSWVERLNTQQERKTAYESLSALEKTALDVGLAFSSHQIGYWDVDAYNRKDRIVELERLIEQSPSDSVTRVACVAWTRLRVAELLKEKTRDGSKVLVTPDQIKNLFTHPYYIEEDGYDRFFLEKNSDAWYSNSDAIRVFITTQKQDVINSIKERNLLDLRFCKIGHLTGDNFSVYKKNLQKLIESNEVMYGLLDDVIAEAQADIADMESYLKLLSDEIDSKAVFDDYIRLKHNRVQECRIYVEKRLKEFSAQRQQIESKVHNLEHLSTENAVRYQKFLAAALDGKFKKIKPEAVQQLLEFVIYPSIELCEKAIHIYPIPNSSKLLNFYQEQENICLLLKHYYEGTLKVRYCDTVAKNYPNSVFAEFLANLRAAQAKLDVKKK